MEIKNIEKAARRIEKAIQNNERIILYGDADLDGVSSVIILKEAIENLSGKVVAVYFPSRETEGYGLTETGLKKLKNFSPALLITLDLGISNFKEVKMAQKMKFEVVIIDHHQVLDKLPQAKIIVDPKQKKERYPFKELANTGIVFKLSEILLEEKMTESLRRNFLELTALATIADMMPKEKDNLEFISQGLAVIENSWRPGIQALLQSKAFKSIPNLNQKILKIISLLNVRDIENGLPASYRLLTSSSLSEAKKLIKKLLKKDKIRREEIKNIVATLEERIKTKKSPLIFEGDPDWDFGLLPTVASTLCQKYRKPTFIFKKLKEKSEGTVRSPSNIDSVDLMKHCKQYLLSFGGHARASGFRVKNKNLEKFEKCLIRYCPH